MLSVPKVRTELGKTAFRFALPSARNMLWKTLKQNELVSLNTFKGTLDELEAETSVGVLPEAFIILALKCLLFWMLCVFNVCVHLVFVCMYDYAAACLGQDTLAKSQ